MIYYHKSVIVLKLVQRRLILACHPAYGLVG